MLQGSKGYMRLLVHDFGKLFVQVMHLFVYTVAIVFTLPQYNMHGVILVT